MQNPFEGPFADLRQAIAGPHIPVYQIHTLENPFCPLPGCGCHTNQQEIARLLEQVREGLLTLREAADFAEGRLVY